MSDTRRTARSGLCAVALVAFLTACGGGGSASPAPTGSGPVGNTGGNSPGNGGGDAPAAIQGVATPSSVSVVTATNAN